VLAGGGREPVRCTRIPIRQLQVICQGLGDPGTRRNVDARPLCGFTWASIYAGQWCCTRPGVRNALRRQRLRRDVVSSGGPVVGPETSFPDSIRTPSLGLQAGTGKSAATEKRGLHLHLHVNELMKRERKGVRPANAPRAIPVVVVRE
jgi:hypothetical protein